ncbi:hypothetical protein V8F20_000721 [Naviculisporaceae sp. PSN 640]
MSAPSGPEFTSSWTVRTSAGEPFAIVEVNNLAAVIQAASDAWGRPNRLQPVQVSAELSFALPFASAASDDRLGNDTVHYGMFSQNILDSLASFSTNKVDSPPVSLRQVLDRIWAGITGQHLDLSLPLPVLYLDKPLLTSAQLARVKFLSITVTLPKASLLGEGVSLTASSVFSSGTTLPPTSIAEKYGVSLAINKLRVPTLVGINLHERQAKQFVITTVTIDKFAQREDADIYTDVEALVVNTLESSTFETLEALGAHLADCILTKYRSDDHACRWLVHVRMEKPTATPFAEYPVVEMRAGCAFPAMGRPNVSGLESPR